MQRRLPLSVEWWGVMKINNATVIAFVALYCMLMFQPWWKAAIFGAVVALVCCAVIDAVIYLVRRLTQRT